MMTSPRKQRSRRNTDNLDDLDLTNRLSEDPNDRISFNNTLGKENGGKTESFVVVDDRINMTMREDMGTRETRERLSMISLGAESVDDAKLQGRSVRERFSARNAAQDNDNVSDASWTSHD